MNHENEKIKKKLDAARAELLDLGRGNPLINYKTFKARGVEIVDELSRHIYQILVHDNKAMSFLPATDLEDEKLMFTDDKAEKDPARHTDSKLQTSHATADLQKRLMATHRLARTSIEEQGVNTLYLALGMLEWYESESSDITNLAPLILIPVIIDRTNVRARFRVRYAGEEIGTNLSLQEKLRKEFGFDLPDFSGESNQSVINYFQSIRKEIENFKRWKIDENKIALGFFSFAKLLMYRDLDADNWPDKALQQHNVLSSLLGAPFQEAEASVSDDVSNIDEHLPATMVNHVVDADSSQALAIHDVSQGRNLIIQGPPGTGKSQTITNIIAEAIAKNKRVLFVAEKMAALEVVKRNLDKVGLGHPCLELHSNKANKKDVIDELKSSREIGEKNSSALEHTQLEDRRNVLNDYCKAINSPIGESGETTYRLYGKLLQLQKRLDKIDIPPLTYQGKYSASAIKQAVAQAKSLQRHLKGMGAPKKHLFWDCKKFPSRDVVRRIAGKAKEATAELKKSAELLAEHVKMNAPDNTKKVEEVLDTARNLLGAPKIIDIKVGEAEWLTHSNALQQKFESGIKLRNFHKEYDEFLIIKVLSQNISEDYKNLVAYRQRWWRFLSYKYHRAHAKVASLCKRTPSSLDSCIRIAEDIINAQQAQQQVAYMRETGQRLFGTHWQGEASDWSSLQEVTTYLSTIHKSIEDGELPKALLAYLAENPDLNKLRELFSTVDRWQKDYWPRFQQILEEIQLDEVQHFGKAGLKGLSLAEQVQILERWELEAEKLQDIAIYNDLIKKLKSSGFVIKEPESSSFVDVVAIANDWPDASEFLSDVLEYTYYDGLLAKARQEYPILTRFSGALHQDNVERFKELDELSLEVNRVKIANQHRQNLFQNIDARPRRELHVITREYEKKRKHRPIRKLMLDAWNAIQIIKPVFMMSPLSVAEFLPRGKISFDMVIFDEASQVKPIDAYGAIIRGKQTVVIGDQHQLPPTDFFSKHIDDDDRESEEEENNAADIESILGLFNAQNAPQRMLRWHYRSRHESLIALSNKEFYQNKLLLFPSPDAEKSEVGLVYHYLPNTTYDRGNSHTNLGEAKIIAEKVMEHANKHSQRTLGVVTFSVAQMRAIEDQLEILRRNDSSHEQTFFNTHGKEPFFIKNLENVQGDERDVIFISVGYGRDSNGKILMNFGPLGRDGGERRLNVIITRARMRCEVFTNLAAHDIDLSRSKGRGIEVLKNYLEYAKTGKLTDSPKPTGEADSPFEEEVANALRQRGYEVDHQIGSAGYFIDLGIKDKNNPGRYVLGIECDGATYHSAKSARDRDRLRQLVLEKQGWRIHRIWSTDWFNRPQREEEKALAAIKKAELETPVKNSDSKESEESEESEESKESKESKESEESEE